MMDPFRKISEEQKKTLFKNLEAVTLSYDKDCSILSTFKINNILAIVTKGNIQVLKTDYNGNRTLVEELRENAVFGSKISFLIDDECELITQEPSQIILLDYYNLLNYNDASDPVYNQFLINILEITIDIITQRNERIKVLTQRSIRDKLLEYFKLRSEEAGSLSFVLPFSFTDLADYLAIDRSAMTREMKYLKEEGFITVKGRKITMNYR